MNKAKEILQKHTKSNGCKLSLQENPFLEQALINAINEAINYSRCCKSDSELLPNMTLEQAIAKAKPNLDKITDVDKHIEDIR